MKKIILFDFDGVIVDSFQIAYQLSKSFHPELSEEDYRDKFMGNIYDAFDNGKTDERVKTDNNKWFDVYNPQLLKLDIISGMVEILKQLAQKYTLIVISSTLTSPIHTFLEQHNVHYLFDKVYGADVHKSKKEKINMVFKNYNAEPDHCIFITDTVGDLREAKDKKIGSIVVTWGFHQKIRFQDEQPIAYVDEPKQIVLEVDKYFNT